MCVQCEEKVFLGNSHPLKDSLIESILNADKIDIVSSFTKITGVFEIIGSLRKASDRGVKIRFLTGTYLGITDPSALRVLKEECGDNICIRFYKGTNSFHPKAYFFYGKNGDSLYIGSSNLSKSALVDGVEWNYLINKTDSPVEFRAFEKEFERLFSDDTSYEATDEAVRVYERSRVRPRYAPLVKNSNNDVIEKNEVQLEALFNLEKSRDSGMDKALVVAATGTGKTVLAAFDSLNYGKILFIAHTQDILEQARETFSSIRPGDTSGVCYGGMFDVRKDMTFATIQTISRDENLERLAPDTFDYIVIDEFHHAAAYSYRKVVDHFRPKFLLGLTATPERMDNKDVFVLCDYNVVYEIGLKEAIERQFLCRFRYYGIYDADTDYNAIPYVGGSYNADKLTKALANEKRAGHIFDNYLKYGSERSIGFCSSIEHAEYMAEYFNGRGVKSAVVSSRCDVKGSMYRSDAVDSLKDGSLSVVFSVDMFNEGVDIPALDMVMFLRPTESPTVFTQQLGRGLRIYEGKDYLTVLDFIGNYRNADMIPSLLTGSKGGSRHSIKEIAKDLPDGCFADFELGVIRLFERMTNRRRKIKEMVSEEYDRIKEELGHVPSRCELFTCMDPEKWKLIRGRGEANPFKDYMKFLDSKGDLQADRCVLLDSDAYRFLNMLEITSMSRMYKVPLMYSFIDGDRLIFEPSGGQISKAFSEFYSRDNNMVDFEGVKSRERCKWDDRKWLKLAVDNPIRFMCKSQPEFFSNDGCLIRLTSDLEPFAHMKVFIEEMKDILELRTIDFKQNRYYEK